MRPRNLEGLDSFSVILRHFSENLMLVSLVLTSFLENLYDYYEILVMLAHFGHLFHTPLDVD